MQSHINPEMKELMDELNKHFEATMPADTRRVLIVSGNPKEANYYAKLNGWADWKYVSDVQALYGVSNIRIVFCGSHVYRNDRVRLGEMVDEMVMNGKAQVIALRRE